MGVYRNGFDVTTGLFDTPCVFTIYRSSYGPLWTGTRYDDSLTLWVMLLLVGTTTRSWLVVVLKPCQLYLLYCTYVPPSFYSIDRYLLIPSYGIRQMVESID